MWTFFSLFPKFASPFPPTLLFSPSFRGRLRGMQFLQAPPRPAFPESPFRTHVHPPFSIVRFLPAVICLALRKSQSTFLTFHFPERLPSLNCFFFGLLPSRKVIINLPLPTTWRIVLSSYSLPSTKIPPPLPLQALFYLLGLCTLGSFQSVVLYNLQVFPLSDFPDGNSSPPLLFRRPTPFSAWPGYYTQIISLPVSSPLPCQIQIPCCLEFFFCARVRFLSLNLGYLLLSLSLTFPFLGFAVLFSCKPAVFPSQPTSLPSPKTGSSRCFSHAPKGCCHNLRVSPLN